MAKLHAAERNALPSSSFAGPGRSFPIEDKIHAEKAIQLAPRSEHAGNISPGQEASIVRKAKAKLGGDPVAKAKAAWTKGSRSYGHFKDVEKAANQKRGAARRAGK